MKFEDAVRLTNCIVPLCDRNNHCGLFCHEHWVRLPKNTRRKFLVTATDELRDKLVISAVLSDLQGYKDECKRLKERKQVTYEKEKRVQALLDFGYDLINVVMMAREIQRLKELVGE